jgi:putative membrane protein
VAGEPVSSETRDASRRTRLANERTYLAWWRSGLTAFAVSLGVGKLIPGVSGGTAWPYETLGIAFALLGIGFIGLAYLRQRAVEAALRRGDYAAFDERLAFWLALAGAVLGAATVLLIALAG